MERKYVNILLLGETGTGKSTFINAFANYLHFSSIDEVDSADLKCIIPAKFTILTDDEDLVVVKFGDGRNENLGTGNSSTQSAQAHEFEYEDKIIRIIDTPGINDSRGAAVKDDENFEDILRCLARYDELHAVCFLLKPDVTVITPAFKYCLLELLSRLNWSAAANILFVFTRTKGTDYGAPDSLNCLRLLIEEIKNDKGVSVPLRFKRSERKNCFFMDNEGFKFLVARSQGHRMRNEEGLKRSWDISNAASRSMIKYILGDEENAALRPHKVRDTLSVNDARRLIYDLRHSLKDVSELVHASLSKLDDLVRELQDVNLTVEQLRQKLKITRPTFKLIELEYPVTVCGSEGCSEVITMGGVEKKYYKQRCHNPCVHSMESLRDVPVIGALHMWCFCEAINLLGMCKKCECHFSRHMTIYYETELGEEVIEDKGVKVDLFTKDGMIETKNKQLRELRNYLVHLKYERDQIGLAMAKFAHFICNNSICPINDAYEEYLDHLIKSENKGKHCSKQLQERYQCMKEDHINRKKTLKQCELEAKERNIEVVTPDDVMDIYVNLKKLPCFGKLLTKMHESVVKCQAKMKTENRAGITDEEGSFDFNEPYVRKEEDKVGIAQTVKNFFSFANMSTFATQGLGTTVASYMHEYN